MARSRLAADAPAVVVAELDAGAAGGAVGVLRAGDVNFRGEGQAAMASAAAPWSPCRGGAAAPAIARRRPSRPAPLGALLCGRNRGLAVLRSAACRRVSIAAGVAQCNPCTDAAANIPLCNPLPAMACGPPRPIPQRPPACPSAPRAARHRHLTSASRPPARRCDGRQLQAVAARGCAPHPERAGSSQGPRRAQHASRVTSARHSWYCECAGLMLCLPMAPTQSAKAHDVPATGVSPSFLVSSSSAPSRHG